MREMLAVEFRALRQSANYETLVQTWRDRGYLLEVRYPGKNPWLRMLVPRGDEVWRTELQRAVKTGLIGSDWDADYIEDIYSPEDLASAPVFGIIHSGHEIDIPMGRDDIASVTHFSDVDESRACKRCAAGYSQQGPLRLPASDLNKAGSFASIWIGGDAFFMLTKRLADDLADECGDEMPLLEIETVGRTKLKERWLQIVPEFVVPEKAVRELRTKRTECPQCGAVRNESIPGPISGVCFTTKKQALKKIDLPPVMLSPFWEDELSRFPDGRIISYPSRRMWLRADLGHALSKKKIKGLELLPIIYA